jgi:putative ABC transport system permease protein
MESLVLSNLLHRKARTAVSVGGVALGSILIVMTVGLVNGFLRDQGRRNAAVTAEIMFNPPGGTFGLGFSPTLTMPTSLAEQLKSIEGVQDAVPVGQVLYGSRLVDGIDYDSFKRVSWMRIVEGRPPSSDDEVIIDRVLQDQRKVRLGDRIKVFDRPLQIVGIYEPESLGRLKVTLSSMQRFLNRPGLCSRILVKVKDPDQQQEVAGRIKERFPENSVILTRDLPILYSRGTPALKTFLDVVIILSAVISSLIILLAMYTTVTERTRHIGILKSLGASKLWIALEIEKEALLMSLAGVLIGFTTSEASKCVLERFTSLKLEFDLKWFIYATLLGLASGMIGALYPALRAASQDPVRALSYE